LCKYDEAIEDFTEVVRLGCGRAIAPACYYFLGIVELAAGQYNDATADYAHVLELDAEFVSADCDVRRGGSWSATGSLSEFPSEDYYFCRGIAYLGNRDFHKAIADLDEAIRLNPEDAAAGPT
jgi:tetratricopeptide (TPR) repeat protein